MQKILFTLVFIFTSSLALAQDDKNASKMDFSWSPNFRVWSTGSNTMGDAKHQIKNVTGVRFRPFFGWQTGIFEFGTQFKFDIAGGPGGDPIGSNDVAGGSTYFKLRQAYAGIDQDNGLILRGGYVHKYLPLLIDDPVIMGRIGYATAGDSFSSKTSVLAIVGSQGIDADNIDSRTNNNQLDSFLYGVDTMLTFMGGAMNLEVFGLAYTQGDHAGNYEIDPLYNTATWGYGFSGSKFQGSTGGYLGFAFDGDSSGIVYSVKGLFLAGDNPIVDQTRLAFGGIADIGYETDTIKAKLFMGYRTGDSNPSSKGTSNHSFNGGTLEFDVDYSPFYILGDDSLYGVNAPLWSSNLDDDIQLQATDLGEISLGAKLSYTADAFTIEIIGGTAWFAEKLNDSLGKTNSLYAGAEIDLGLYYAITDQLDFFFQGGVMFSGEAYRQIFAILNGQSFGSTNDQILYTFGGGFKTSF